jgi:protein-tyrosine phosphatase
MAEKFTRKIAIESVINFRDLGGYQTKDGYTVAWRRIFRSGDFRNITPDDFARIEKEVGLKAVIDLRTTEEIKQQGKYGFSEAGIRYHHVPFPGDGNNSKDQDKALKACTNLGEFYLQMINSKTFQKQLIAALQIIADVKNQPVAFHCAIGKDRTGILSALLLSILGIDDAAIINDYTLSGPPVQELRDKMMLNPPDIDFVKKIPDYFWEARPETMALFLTTLKQKYGTIVGYLINLGVDTYLIEGIRKVLLN